jgi:hypothetical protein
MDLYDPITQQRLSPPLPPNGSALTAAVQSQVGGSAATAATVIDAYAQAAAAEGRSTSPGDLWIDIFGDRLLRNFGTRYARQLAQAGLNVRYGTYMHAVKPPGRGVPHCAELPVLFGTYGLERATRTTCGLLRAWLGRCCSRTAQRRHGWGLGNAAAWRSGRFRSCSSWRFGIRCSGIRSRAALPGPGDTQDLGTTSPTTWR